jgi:hypothetical protein
VTSTGDASVARQVPGGFHRSLEPVDVHGDARLARDVGGDVQGEAVGVVERERVVAGQNGRLRVGGDGGGEHVGQNLLASAEGRGEPQLLALELVEHLRGAVLDFGVATVAHLDRDRGDRGRERLCALRRRDAEEAPAPHDAANQAAHDVPSSDV